MRKQHILQTSVLVLLVFLLIISVSQTFGYWASSVSSDTDTGQVTIPIGSWQQLSDTEISVQDLEAFAEWIEANGGDIAMVYDNFTVTNGTQISFEDIYLEGIHWDIVGTGTTDRNDKRPTIGFVQVVDRVLDGSNNPVHRIVPPAPTDPVPYPGYSFFLVNDVKNTITNNQTSIRLNYQVSMTTSDKINAVTSVSFYAFRGLYDAAGEGVDYNPMVSRAFTVQVSLDGTSWTQIGTGTPGSTTNTSAAFNFYNFNIPTNFQNQEIYVRINFAGGSVFNGGNHYYSRLVIDALSINT